MLNRVGYIDEFIRLAAEADGLAVFERLYSFLFCHAIYKGSLLRFRRFIDEVDAGLVESYGVKGREDADAVHSRLCGVGEAVAVNGYVAHHVDKDDIAVQMVND